MSHPEKAAAEHKPPAHSLATLDAAFSADTKAVAAREAADKAAEAEDAADAELVAALRALEKAGWAGLCFFFRNSETPSLETRNPRLGLRLCGECYGGWNA